MPTVPTVAPLPSASRTTWPPPFSVTSAVSPTTTAAHGCFRPVRFQAVLPVRSTRPSPYDTTRYPSATGSTAVALAVAGGSCCGGCEPSGHTRHAGPPPKPSATMSDWSGSSQTPIGHPRNGGMARGRGRAREESWGTCRVVSGRESCNALHQWLQHPGSYYRNMSGKRARGSHVAGLKCGKGELSRKKAGLNTKI